jgi:hypothetical protein
VVNVRLEDVKKLICLSFRDFIFDPKCLPTRQRSLIRHPRAIFLTPSSLQILKSIFSHLPVAGFQLMIITVPCTEHVLGDILGYRLAEGITKNARSPEVNTTEDASIRDLRHCGGETCEAADSGANI